MLLEVEIVSNQSLELARASANLSAPQLLQFLILSLLSRVTLPFLFQVKVRNGHDLTIAVANKGSTVHRPHRRGCHESAECI